MRWRYILSWCALIFKIFHILIIMVTAVVVDNLFLEKQFLGSRCWRGRKSFCWKFSAIVFLQIFQILNIFWLLIIIIVIYIFYILFLTSIVYLSIALALNFIRIIHAIRSSSLNFTHTFAALHLILLRFII